MKRLLAAALAVMLTAGCGLLPREEEEAPPVLAEPVKSEKEVYTVRRGAITDKITLNARFAPAQSAELYYRTPGKVKAVHVRSGDSVKAGQVLVELEKETLQYDLAQQQIRLEKARLALEDARWKAQFRNGPSENDLKRLALDLEAETINLEKLRRQVEESRLVAPFEGQVMAVYKKQGDDVAAYAPVVQVANPADLVVEADVDSAALARVAVGQNVRLEFSELGQVTGTVVELPDPLLPASQQKRIKVKPDGAAGKARLGMVGKVHVILQEKDGVLLLPNAALRQFSGRTYVLMKEPRREVDVVVGIQGDTESEITRGLKEGDRVVGR